LPNNIYRRSATFKDNFSISFEDRFVRLTNDRGFVEWEWDQFSKLAESPYFFHLYFSSKSFFLLPKDNLSNHLKYDLRLLLSNKIKKQNG
jgi:hypothetical protein